VSTITADNYQFLQSHVYRDSGIVLDETKLYLMEARLGPILIEQHIRSLDDLCSLVKATSNKALWQKVVEAMTTNETLFFRDVAAFNALQNEVLPKLVEQRASTKRLTIWSAAASSGQEAYSLAMMLLEMGLSGWDLRVLGTDLNHQVLERARTGRYLQIEVNRGLPARYLVKYFRREGLDWQLSDRVRSMVNFAPFDLRDNMAALGTFDIVLCRNVLIYFDIETKKKIIGGIRKVLYPNGLLLLGCAESMFNVSDDFEKVVHGTATFYQAKS
jgi:chemotaxis protein methyltransferase CheR